jgi:hypothetical protein
MTNVPSGMAAKSVVKGIELRADTAIQGLLTAMPAGVTQLTVGTVTYTLPDLVKYAQSVEQPWKDVRQAHATIHQAMIDRSADKQKLEGFLADLKASLTTVLGRGSATLLQFGFKPQQPRKPLTPQQKVERAAKAKLTRALRHTMGSRQKAALKQTSAPSVAVSPQGTVSITPTTGGNATPAAPASGNAGAVTPTA